MCGRFSLHNNHDVQQLPGYDVHVDEWIDQDQFIPRYNIAPRSQAPVIRRNDSNLVMQTMKWGLVPHWSKFEDKALNTTNARSENLVQGGGMWASIKGTKRCAIPCQGYAYIPLESLKFIGPQLL
jgi:putative SOS response-associated peptidase YedK